MDLDDPVPVILLAFIASFAVALVVGYIWPMADQVTRAYSQLGL
jgi:hypothetical protein